MFVCYMTFKNLDCDFQLSTCHVTHLSISVQPQTVKVTLNESKSQLHFTNPQEFITSMASHEVDKLTTRVESK